ncbi:MAG: folylpolyglutamate synthase/dihydrofolate synthase family protein [Candidatus Bathyarchaeia archaeon]
MTYEEVINWIYNLHRFGTNRGLCRVRRLLKMLGDPHRRFRIILVGGTNGKGSTVRMIASILQEAGYKVGVFTKPHLTSFTERIVINEMEISESEVVRLISEMKPYVEKVAACSQHPTFFEVTTALALNYFAQQGVDFAVLEVGIGGRLDATNVTIPLVSVITNVYLEHTQILGNTVLKIAKEKAGIIKTNVVVVTATDNDKVFSLLRRVCQRRRARILRVGEDIMFKRVSWNLEGQTFEVQTPVRLYENLHIPLLGAHQIVNAATAIGAVEALKYYDIHIEEQVIRKGLSRVWWPGRLEVVQRSPLVVLDCAKEPAATRRLKEALIDHFQWRRLILVTSISRDKDIPSIIEEIAPLADLVIVSQHKVQNRAADPEQIAVEVQKHSKPVMIIRDVREAVKEAMSLAGKEDLICVMGSVFAVGEAREMWYPRVRIK